MMIMGIIEKAVRQVWPANSNGNVKCTNCLLLSDENKISGVEPQRILYTKLRTQAGFKLAV